MTQNQTARVKQALTETEQLLNKELSYSQDLQKTDQIAFYRSHLIKLQTMLAA